MAMKLIRKTADYKIFMRGDERYAVQDAKGKPVNGEQKVRVLVEEELIKITSHAPSSEKASEADAKESIKETDETAQIDEIEETSDSDEKTSEESQIGLEGESQKGVTADLESEDGGNSSK